MGIISLENQIRLFPTWVKILLFLTTKENVWIEIYRTLVNGEEYYIDASRASDKTSQTTAMNLGETTDTVISSLKTLYTTGGVLDNIAPQLGQTAVKNNRIFTHVGNNRIWFSKEIIPNVGPEFNDTLFFDIDKDYGAVTALTKIGDALIIFAEKGIWSVYGTGPAPTGSGSPFQPPRIISREMGCKLSNNVGLSLEGCYFNSHRGVYLLGDGLGASFTGAPIEDEITTLSRVLSFDDNVRLLSSGDDAWYTLQKGKWSKATNVTSLVDFAQLNNEFYWVSSAGKVSKEETGFTEGTGPVRSINMVIDTAWIKLDNFVGAQRVWEIILLGEYISPHTLTVGIYYDYSTSSSETVTKSITEDPGPYIMTLRPARQKCSSIRLRIEDSDQSGTEESFALSGIGLLVGIRPGLHKSSPEQRLTRS